MTSSNTNQSCVVDIHTVAAFFPVPSPRVWKQSTELAGGSAGSLLGVCWVVGDVKTEMASRPAERIVRWRSHARKMDPETLPEDPSTWHGEPPIGWRGLCSCFSGPSWERGLGQVGGGQAG